MKQISDHNQRNDTGSRGSPTESQNNSKKPQRSRPRIGEAFSPYKRFHVLPFPDSLLQSTEFPAGAKLVYGRLCRYAGQKSFGWPTPATLGAEVGLGERQVQKYLDLFEIEGYIRREQKFGSDGRQMSNNIVLLWHASFEDEDGPSKESDHEGKQTDRELAKRIAREQALAPFISEDGSIKIGDLRLYSPFRRGYWQKCKMKITI